MEACAPSKFSTPCSEEQAELRDSSPEGQCLFKLLEVYWGKGDGSTPPEFIAQAAKLCGFPLQTA